MSDPLSVAASVVGLVTAGAQMITTLYNIGSSIKDAPQLTRAAANELANITIVLQQLQSYVLGKAKVSIQRLQLITVEHITATLTGCVVTYSELDAVLKSLNAETGMRAWDRGMWYLKKDKVTEIVQRLQNHKATLGLMLNIIQCASLNEAETSMDRLCDAVNEVLRTNQELSMRLRNMEDLQTARPSDQTRPADEPQVNHGASSEPSGGDGDDDSSRHSTASAAHQDRPSQEHGRVSGDHGMVSNFEELLHRSRVYRHVDPSDSTPSLMSDARSTLALSICSSLTLGEVSNISVYAIPVYANELSNASCYRFDPISTHKESHASMQAGEDQTAGPNTPQKRQWRAIFKRSPREKTADVVQAAEAGIFGVPLNVSIRYANVAISLFGDDGKSYIYGYVPIVVAKCGVFLKEKGTDVENLFSTSSNLRHLRELQVVFDSPPRYGKGWDWSGYTVFDAANLLLRYIHQLPEPLIPLDFFERFCQPLRDHQADAVGASDNQYPSIGTFDSDAVTKTYQGLIKGLPPLSRQFLLYMLDLLAVFASKSDLNKMTTSKLSAHFQPGVLSHPQHRLTTMEVRLAQDVLIFLIENQDAFLIGML